MVTVTHFDIERTDMRNVDETKFDLDYIPGISMRTLISILRIISFSAFLFACLFVLTGLVFLLLSPYPGISLGFFGVAFAGFSLAFYVRSHLPSRRRSIAALFAPSTYHTILRGFL